eukprot:CAMPEP_0195515152 /NCGR_PEP_ID=MMETSP0794_2-20130614/6325_1 /TAXON_ID=515487 /ORGANISM="Stephanopyxis turris, Strain CCMP 815" /LENGTH=163 /DNA_ID=CAMNT_0040643535 /DNA_START=101 /DNA_END=592 /DNA_ORIENTATION=+
MATSACMRSMMAGRAFAMGTLRPSTQKIVASKFTSTRFASTYFTPAHEYVTVDGNIGTCGITDFAQSALGDIVYVDLPEVGDEFEKGDSFGSVESVKAASDVYAPVSGTVVEVNETLSDEPETVNAKAETDAWFIKIELSSPDETGDLMGADAYKAHCEAEES